MKKGKRYLFLLVGLALLWVGLTVACETEPPVVLRFSSSPAEISTGESATLSWIVKDATSVSINHGVGVVENVGSKKVSPSATITYTLIATNSGGAVAKSVVVIVSATSPPSPDTSPPVISGVDVSNITDSSARITWTTDEPATGQIEYGLTESYGSITPLDNNLIKSHGVTISGLNASTTYHFRVKSKDASGNDTTDTDRTFTTSATADTTAPVISAVNTSGTTQSSVTITWTTNEAATSQVMYGATTSYGSTTTPDTNLVTSHIVVLSGLSASTTYHFNVKSKDASGNERVDADRTFSTSATADTTAPVISAVNTSGINYSSATITWTTNEPATSQVMYGATTSYGSTTPLDTNLVTSHSVTLSGLSASTTYHFKAKSKDASGNEAVSGDYTVLTSEAATEVGGIISTDTTWTEENSPYKVTSRVQIPLGVTLTIEPGVTVSSSEFLVNGTLSARGAEGKRIVFDGFEISTAGSTADTVVDIDYCIIRNGSFWPSSNLYSPAHLTLRHSELSNMGEVAYLQGLGGDVYIEYNKFTNVGRIAVGCTHNVYIRYNLFDTKRPGQPPGFDCWIYCWASGGQDGSKKVIVKYNSFINTEGIAIELATNASTAAVSATENYWGTQDTNAIDTMIYDKNDSILITNYIEYLPILTQPHPDTPSLQ